MKNIKKGVLPIPKGNNCVKNFWRGYY